MDNELNIILNNLIQLNKTTIECIQATNSKNEKLQEVLEITKDANSKIKDLIK